MPDFKPHEIDWVACRDQVRQLQALLDSSDDLGEATLCDLLEPSLHLRAAVGHYNRLFRQPDRLAWQYPIFGEFRCDFAIGDWTRKAYTFIECQDARPNSIFVRQGARATRAWSPRFEGGYSQLIDWFYKFDVMTNTPDMEARLGERSVRYVGVLIIGRDQHLTAGERLRLKWWQDHVVVNSRHIFCVTYDELIQDLLFFIDKFAGGAQAQKKV
jgi:hypothetical protein